MVRVVVEHGEKIKDGKYEIAKLIVEVSVGWATKLKILKIEYAWVEFLLCVLIGIRNMFLKIDRSKIDDAAIFSLQDLKKEKGQFS